MSPCIFIATKLGKDNHLFISQFHYRMIHHKDMQIDMGKIDDYAENIVKNIGNLSKEPIFSPPYT